MTYKRAYTSVPGLSRIVQPGDAGIERIGFGLLQLQAGETHSAEAGAKETAMVLLGGTAAVRGRGFAFEHIGTRAGVFGEKAATVYLPAGNGYTITAETAAEIAVCQADSTREGCPVLIPPERVKEVAIGRDNWRRTAHMLVDDDVPAQYLFIGEAYVPPGNWASYPPHRHDFDALPEEVDMEEIYFFRFDRPRGFGIQKIYTDDRSIDETITVEENDTVLIPEGYHPVVAAPGYGMYYLWIMAGAERRFLQRLDPNHRWVAQG